MIYLVSKNSLLFESTDYKIINPNQALELLKDVKILGLDTETQGLDPYTKKLLTVQLGNEEFQIVWDCLSYDIQLLKPIIEDDSKLFLLWNASFDNKFLIHHRIFISNIYDGMLAEQLLYNGYPDYSFDLKSAVIKYCGITLNKEIRGQIIDKGLTESVIVYAARDVEYLPIIYNKQMELLKQHDLVEAIKFENKVVPVISYIEYCGVKLDVNKWKEKMNKDQENLDSCLKELNKIVIDEYNKNPEHEIWKNIIYISPYYEALFEEEIQGPQCIINWDSSKQVIPLLKYFGFNCKIKVGGITKETASSKIIEQQLDVHPIGKYYVKFKEYIQLIKAFGDKMLNLINPVTHRIHASFWQIGTNTARMSSTNPDESWAL